MRLETGVASEQIYPASQMLAEITRVPVQPNKAITGRNAFAHEAGIHQDGMLKNPLTYEIMTPQSVACPIRDSFWASIRAACTGFAV